MFVTAADIARILEEWAPLSLLASWDKGGFQAGDPRRKVTRLLVALDVDSQTVAAALAQGAEMVISHHPLIFSSVENLRLDHPHGALLAEVVRTGLVVYCAHTNLDQAAGGTSDLLAGKVGLEETEVLEPTGQEDIYKIVVFVPEGHEDEVRVAMAEAGAGWIGNYSHCTFRVAGQGTFKPLAGSRPFLGTSGQLQEVVEYRLETIATARRLPQVLAAMLRAHPYEEVAYDLYRLDRKGKTFGFGCVGRLPAPQTLAELAQRVKMVLDLDHVRVVGKPDRRVTRVAVCGGSGGSFLEAAIERKVDVFITGDIKYHEAILATQAGIALIDAGHQGTEKGLVPALADYLRRELAARQMEVEVLCWQPQELFWVK